MHLLINATEIGRQRGGNEAYLLGLLGGLCELACSQHQIELLATDEGVRALSGHPQLAHLPTASIGRYHRLRFYLWQQTQHLRQTRPDWYLATFFLPPVLPARGAVLVHDMSFRARPEYFPQSIALYMRLLTGMAIRQAERIIALSEFTRREIVRFHPSAAPKIVVIYPGVGREFTARPSGSDQTVLQHYALQPGYILAVGNIHPRKNLARVLQAFKLLRARLGHAIAMVWAGHQRWSSDTLTEQAQQLGVHIVGFVSPEHLPALYRQSGVLVYPSLYEGFGLPPVEAMACGAPVVVSNSTALPEAVGKAGLLVDPNNAVELAESIERVLQDAALRRQLREQGLARAQELPWSQTASKLLNALSP